MSSQLLSEQQKEFQDSLRRYFQDILPAETLQKHLNEQGISFFEGMRDLGISSYLADAEEEAGLTELGLLAFESGAVLFPDNYYASVFGGAFLFNRRRDGSKGSEMDPAFSAGLASDDLRIAVAPPFLETVEFSESSGKYSGVIDFVHDAGAADYFLFFYNGECLLFPKKSFSATEVESLDISRKYFRVSIDSAEASRLEGVDSERLRDELTLLHCAEISGLCSAAVGMTTNFVRERKQFGVPVGGFQAVQHRIVDMYLDSEAIRACTFFGLWAADNSSGQLPLAARAAALQVAKKAAGVVEGAIQMHGGIGFTWEHNLHLYLRRAKMFEILSRGAREQAETIADQV